MVTEMTPTSAPPLDSLGGAAAPTPPTAAPLMDVPPGAYAQVPPYVPSEPPPRRGVSAVVLVVIAAVALLVGAAVGYAAGLPGRNALQDDKASVETAKAQVQSDLDATRKDLGAARDELASARSDASASSEAKATCSTAATDAADLVEQYDNLLNDISAWAKTANGSAAEAQMANHINEQMERMRDQYIIVQDELKACSKAVG